jgi:S1-C subfamily serine protease
MLYMKRSHNFAKIIGIALAALLIVSAMGLVAAQDDTTAGTPYLGVNITATDNGALVTRVARGSAADKAGVKIGDIITAVNGESVTADALATTIQGMAVGDEVTLTVLRDGETSELTATLGEMRQPPEDMVRPLMDMIDRPYLGVTLEDADPGARITQVFDNTAAATAGLQVGDIITKVNDTAVSDAPGTVEAIQALKAGDTVVLTVLRDGEEMEFEAVLDSIGAEVTLTDRNFNMPFMNGLALAFDGTNWSIAELPEDNALYEAGLRPGDILTAVNGQSLDAHELMQILMGLGENDTVTFTVTRDGESMDIEVPASALPMTGRFHYFGDDADTMPGFNFGDGSQGMFGRNFGGVQLGVTYIMLDEQVAEQRGVDVTEGALVTEVVAGSPAETAGLQVGDVVTAVDGDKVDIEHTLRDRLYAYESGDTVTLDVTRSGESMQLSATLGQVEMSSDMMPFMRRGNGFPYPLNPQDGNRPGRPFGRSGSDSSGAPDVQPSTEATAQPNL